MRTLLALLILTGTAYATVSYEKADGDAYRVKQVIIQENIVDLEYLQNEAYALNSKRARRQQELVDISTRLASINNQISTLKRAGVIERSTWEADQKAIRDALEASKTEGINW